MAVYGAIPAHIRSKAIVCNASNQVKTIQNRRHIESFYRERKNDKCIYIRSN